MPGSQGLSAQHTGEYLYTWRSSWTFALIIVFLCKRLQYSGRMTIKDLPKELLKIKGRERLPQIYPNHINNMATKTHADPSFKSKHFSLVLEFKFNVSFSLVVLRGFLAIITGLVGEYSMFFFNTSSFVHGNRFIIWRPFVLMAIVFRAKFIWNRGVDSTADLSVSL